MECGLSHWEAVGLLRCIFDCTVQVFSFLTHETQSCSLLYGTGNAAVLRQVTAESGTEAVPQLWQNIFTQIVIIYKLRETQLKLFPRRHRDTLTHSPANFTRTPEVFTLQSHHCFYFQSFPPSAQCCVFTRIPPISPPPGMTFLAVRRLVVSEYNEIPKTTPLHAQPSAPGKRVEAEASASLPIGKDAA